MGNLIGIIDSGVGGLSIASAVIKNLPNESLIYIADSKNCPYGIKSDEEICSLSQRMVDFLIEKEIKLLIIACNTITVTSIDKLRRIYPNLPIIGIVPVVKTAIERSKNKKIGIYSTKATANSVYQKNLIEKFSEGYRVINFGSSGLVSYIENLDFEKIDKLLDEELNQFIKAEVDVLVLGCSHFPLIKDRIQNVLPNVLILDSAFAVARQLERILVSNKIKSSLSSAGYKFYTTGDESVLRYFASKFTNEPKIERISI